MIVSQGIAKRRLLVVPALVWLAVVAGVSLVSRERVGWVAGLAASPERVREGRLWFLFTSAVLVERPVLLSLFAFAALAALAWRVCGARVFWLSALWGQVAATVLVYLFIGVARLLVSGAYASVIGAPDYGVSAVSAAWLGSVAAVGWRRRGRSLAGKASISVSCVAVALFAYTVRPDLTVLSSEHFVAFALGVAVAIPGLGRSLFERLHVWRSPRESAGWPSSLSREAKWRGAIVLMASLLGLAVIAAPVALGTLRREIALHLPPTVSRCLSDWNRPRTAPRSLVRGRQIRAVSLSVTRQAAGAGRHPVERADSKSEYCRYVISDGKRATVVLGQWRHGAVSRWIVQTKRRVWNIGETNAILRTNGQVVLSGRHRSRLLLS